MNRRFRIRGNIFLKITLLVSLAMFLSAMLVGSACILLLRLGVIELSISSGAQIFVIIILVSSTIVGSIFSLIGFRRPLRPFDDYLNAMQEIQKGNYNVRVEEDYRNEMISGIAKSFNTMAQELSSIETLRSDFIDSFSHEFKTPIASIKGFAKLLKNPKLSEEERKEYLDIIIDESERLSRLAANTLNITKIESLEMVVEKKEYRLDEQIRQCIVLLEPRWSKKHLNMNIELSEVVYKGNEELMQQVWINLIDNAVKFTPDGGEIVVSLQEVQNSAIAAISDNGIGMNEETQKRMFDKFFQGDRSRAMEGNGVGLSVVKKLIDVSDGKIKVKSAPGEGTIITVILPLGSLPGEN